MSHEPQQRRITPREADETGESRVFTPCSGVLLVEGEPGEYLARPETLLGHVHFVGTQAPDDTCRGDLWGKVTPDEMQDWR